MPSDACAVCETVEASDEDLGLELVQVDPQTRDHPGTTEWVCAECRNDGTGTHGGSGP